MSEALQTQVVETLIQLVLAVVTLLGLMFMEFLRRKIGNENIAKLKLLYETNQMEVDLIKRLSISAVRWAEQKLKEETGLGKSVPASEFLSKELKEIGIYRTPEQIDVYIHDALRHLKDVYGNAWATELNEISTDSGQIP